MKRRRWIVVILVVLAIVAAGALVPVLASSGRARRVIGTVKFTMPLYDGNPAPAWAIFYVTELDRDTGAASGRYIWWTISETLGVASVTVDVECVRFEGKRVAEFSGKAIAYENWPPPLQACAQYAKIRVRDRGARDEFGFYRNECSLGGIAPGFECDPCDAEVCGPGELLSFAVEEGNLLVR